MSYMPPRGVRRKADEDFEQNPRQTKIPKKILVACDFCRGMHKFRPKKSEHFLKFNYLRFTGRKLRCDGIKPTCCNCDSRGNECKYEPGPKRRGPGKAPKGTRAKKRVFKGRLEGRLSESSSSHAAQGSADDFDLQTLAPELRSQASIDSGLHSISSETTLVGGRYASQQPSLERTPQQRRPSRSTSRRPSSEYSPPESASKR
ncbi:hypothetical protein B0H10DRAFT_242810 [Mycena sp. CBHHK59/15]|nr:hypothetical protein B0H10DRAFT_242810 [Mycena sp. CBHHK59/15]